MKKTAYIGAFAALFCVLTVVLPCSAAADEIAIGDSKEKALDVLGAPKGQMAVGGGLLLLYDRGTVTIEKGKVTGTTIVSEAEAQAAAEEKARQEAARKAARAVAVARRKADGLAEKRKKEVDEDFLAKPAKVRLAYWRTFRKKYPEVSVDDKIAPLAKEVEGDRKADRKKVVTERIAKIEKEELPTAEKDAERQYQHGGQRKRRAAKNRRDGLRAELAKLKAELKTL